MEYYLFRKYLKFREDNQKKLWDVVKKTPWYFILPFVLGLIAAVISVGIPFFVERAFISLLFPIISLGCFGLCDLALERIQIRDSAERYEKHWDRAWETKVFLAENNLTACDKIREVKKRIDVRIDSLKTERNKRNDGYRQWLHVLAVPLLLAAASALFAQQPDFASLIVAMILLLFMFFVFIALASVVKDAYLASEFSEYSKLCQFSEDLQAVLDIETFHIDPPCEDSLDTPNT